MNIIFYLLDTIPDGDTALKNLETAGMNIIGLLQNGVAIIGAIAFIVQCFRLMGGEESRTSAKKAMIWIAAGVLGIIFVLQIIAIIQDKATF